MSTIHDKNKKTPVETQVPPLVETAVEIDSEKCSTPSVLESMVGEIPQERPSQTNGADIKDYQEKASEALSLVNDVVLKNYLANLSKMELVAMPELSTDGVVLFKIGKMAFEKDEYATDKFISIVSSMTFTNSSIFLLLDGHKDHTDFFLGVRCDDESRTARSVADTFKSSVLGHFPGVQMKDISIIEKGASFAEQDKLFAKIKEAKSISLSVGVPSIKSKDQDRTNSGYIQGVEKLALAMRGKEYTVIVLAKNQTPEDIHNIRKGYETLYTQLSSQASQQLAYSNSESMANSFTSTKGYTDTQSVSEMSGKTHSLQYSKANTEGESSSIGGSQKNIWGKVGSIAEPLFYAGTYLTATGVGAPAGFIMMGLGAAAGLGKVLGEGSKSTNRTKSKSETYTVGTNEGFSESSSKSSSHADNFSMSNGQTATIGESKTVTLTIRDKHIEELLKRIDNQLERINQAESSGLWQTSAYFLSYENDRATSEIAATIFRSIMQGENSGIEASAINSWYIDKESNDNKHLLPTTISCFSHPVFSYKDNAVGADIQVTGTSLINSAELAMMMGLPRKSVPGLPVVEHISIGKEVVRLNWGSSNGIIDIGAIFDQGVEHQMNKVKLDAKSLTQHVFVTGSTGCGKSETVYRLIEQIVKAGAKYLIVEPAKGEYKSVFGDANVFGTNPSLSPLIRINPFRFPNGIHILEHIDRLVEIFNVCWPMYAAMPAVLKKAVIRSYEACGWNLYGSTNTFGNSIFPSFVDLLKELEATINESAYSEEVKGNYIGSLVTRVESLTNGINGEIFSSDEVGDDVLFDQNTIVDLSRIGAQETKALIMGILIMRLNEYRVVNAKEANSKLRHVTVLEEAHNILPRTSTEQSMEGSNVTGKSVEMLINSIAEMRTYGESFVIVDQSPTSVHSAAIKNTNTKIIMRLPDGDDRRIAGKSAALKENEIDELSKLATGVAVVYQNDWLQPVMCKVKMSQQERKPYIPTPDRKQSIEHSIPINDLLILLLKGRLSKQEEPDVKALREGVEKANIPVSHKIKYLNLIKEYESSGKLEIWKDEHFKSLSAMVVSLLGVEKKVEDFAKQASSFDELNQLLSGMLYDEYNVPAYMDLTLRQVMMRNYGELGTSQLKIYNAWLNDIKTA